MDKWDRNIEPKMQEIVTQPNGSNVHSPYNLEMVDQETFLLLQRLAKAGVITFNQETCLPLYQSNANAQSRQLEKQRQLQEAKKHLSAAERKLKMSRLLSSEGFVLEALPAMSEAIDNALKCYAAIKKEASKSANMLYQKLAKKDAPWEEAEALSLLSSAENVIEETSDFIIKWELGPDF